MRNHRAIILNLALLIAWCASTVAQQPTRKFYCGYASLLVYQKSVADDLKLEKDQLAKAIEAAERVRVKYEDELNKAGLDKDGVKWSMVYPKVAEESNKALAQVLTPEHMKRLDQIHKQVYLHSTLLAPENAKLFNFTAEQQGKLKELSKQGFPGMSATEEKAWYDKTLSVLTPEQKKVWESIVGPPYNRR
jgi:hypothetical protein